ncbi:hypothetical protein FQA39_LY01240 [Lamprigera yunnana]|nr:hypothetical protein FQA39_LY01240 [Lamprigera yunnana]
MGKSHVLIVVEHDYYRQPPFIRGYAILVVYQILGYNAIDNYSFSQSGKSECAVLKNNFTKKLKDVFISGTNTKHIEDAKKFEQEENELITDRQNNRQRNIAIKGKTKTLIFQIKKTLNRKFQNHVGHKNYPYNRERNFNRDGNFSRQRNFDMQNYNQSEPRYFNSHSNKQDFVNNRNHYHNGYRNERKQNVNSQDNSSSSGNNASFSPRNFKSSRGGSNPTNTQNYNDQSVIVLESVNETIEHQGNDEGLRPSG